MEDHLKNKDRRQKEWEALCSYQAEPSAVSLAHSLENMDKNSNPRAFHRNDLLGHNSQLPLPVRLAVMETHKHTAHVSHAQTLTHSSK